MQRKDKPEDKNAAVSVNKANLKQSKQDLGKESSSTDGHLDNCEIQHDKNNSKCMKTETEPAAAEGNSCQETSEEQESSSNALENEQDNISTDVPVQKKRKRCWTCNAKLELAQRELGNCRCSKY